MQRRKLQAKKIWGVIVKMLSDMAGMPVVSAKSGDVIGEVKEPIFTPEGTAVAGMATTIRGNGNRLGLVFLEDILDIGKDAILIFDSSSIEHRKKEIRKHIQASKWVCKNKKVLTKDGAELGIIKDGAFDEKTGKISEVAISQGIFEDILDGRRKMVLSSKTEFGKDYILIPGGNEYESQD